MPLYNLLVGRRTESVLGVRASARFGTLDFWMSMTVRYHYAILPLKYMLGSICVPLPPYIWVFLINHHIFFCNQQITLFETRKIYTPGQCFGSGSGTFRAPGSLKSKTSTKILKKSYLIFWKITTKILKAGSGIRILGNFSN